MSEPEITNPEKTKNPKRVEQGKRLAEISREAKRRKRQQQEEFFESAKQEENKILSGIGLIGAVGVVGAAFLAYKIFLNSEKEPNEVRLADEEAAPRQDEAQTEDDRRLYTEPKEPNEVRLAQPPADEDRRLPPRKIKLRALHNGLK